MQKPQTGHVKSNNRMVSHTNTHPLTYALPHKCNLTPQGHEDGEEDGGRVVEEVRGSGGAAGGAEVPEVTRSITQGTHGEVQTLVAHLLTEGVENQSQGHITQRSNNIARVRNINISKIN